MDDIYLGTLKAGDVKKVGTELSSVIFKFRNGEQVRSLKLVEVPSKDDCRNIFIETDVVNCDISL